MTTVTVRKLHYGTVQLPASHPQGPGRCPIQGFLVQDDDFMLLVDTGMGIDSALLNNRYQPKLQDLNTVLTLANIEMRQIDAVVNSHLHFDHCGQNRAFPGVPIYVQATEYEAADAPHYTVTSWLGKGQLDYQMVHGDKQLTARIKLITTPGHTTGHQSVVVSNPAGVVVIACQAVYDRKEYCQHLTGHSGKLDTDDPDTYMTSVKKLLGYEPKQVYFSHDPDPWTCD